MARTRLKSKGRRDGGSYIAMPHIILESAEYAALSPQAVKLLIDLFSQFRGVNNGDLSAAWKIMSARGWRSKATLYRALHELIANGWIEMTRRGGIHRCSLYAVTWLAIDECGGKLDVSPTRIASGKWKKEAREHSECPAQRLYLGGPMGVPVASKS